jgi:hypothetical protein
MHSNANEVWNIIKDELRKHKQKYAFFTQEMVAFI